MSDFGALEVNWRPPPQGRKACCERSEADERLRESFLAKREKTAGGLGGLAAPSKPPAVFSRFARNYSRKHSSCSLCH